MMSCENKPSNTENVNSDHYELNFITSAQYVALQRHFSKIIENMKEKDEMRHIQVEFSNLINMFETCYGENEQKTCKIRELLALNAVEVKKIKLLSQRIESLESPREEIKEDLEKQINNLQRNLGTLMDERTELLEEISRLKHPVETEDKMLQTDVGTYEPRSKVEIIRKSSEYPIKENASSGDESLDRNLDNKGITDHAVLKSNLEILVADLNLARTKIKDLKRVIRLKDSVQEEYCKDLSDIELKLKEEEKKTSKIQKPMQMSLEKCKKELDEKKRILQDLEKDFEKVANLNAKLDKEKLSKDSALENLTIRMKNLEEEMKVAVRKAETFEKHLAASQIFIEELKRENESLQQKIYNLTKIPAVVPTQDSSQEKGKYVELSDYEKMVENYRNKIILRDKKLYTVGEELKATIEILCSIRKDHSSICKQKSSIESENKMLSKFFKEKNTEIKQLKDKLKAEKKEIADLRKEIHNLVIKQKQMVDKKDKFHSMYTHMKFVNNQQRSENMMLCKRQEYLINILKDKDTEIEKLIKWKTNLY